MNVLPFGVYGNFDIVLRLCCDCAATSCNVTVLPFGTATSTSFASFFSLFSLFFQLRVNPHTLCHELYLLSAYRMPIGACNPMVCLTPVFRT